MTKICITGANGMIGRHAQCYLMAKAIAEPDRGISVVAVDHHQFGDPAQLQLAIADSDVVFHFAGQNRGPEAEVAAANVEIASQLVDALSVTRSSAHVLYSNSTHSLGDSSYGKSKRAVACQLRRWESSSSGKFTDVLLPHVFGECGKPFYNSAVSTFCHQLATGDQPKIDRDGQVELLHATAATKIFFDGISDPKNSLRPSGVVMRVSELLSRLQSIDSRYREGVVPELSDDLTRRLFNTYRSYIPHDDRPRTLQLHSDDRGGLFEAIRSDGRGQVFLSTTHPGITRGNHFHLRKVERFLVIQGTAKIRLRHVLDDSVHTFDVSGTKPKAIDIPTMHTHNITNVGDDELLTLFWAHEHFDPTNSDTYYLEV